MNIERLYQLFLLHPSIQTDTRKLKGGDLFFALKGPNFNGNQFAIRALELGAAYAIIDEIPSPATQAPAALSERLILVDDVLTTLQALALHHRRQFDIPFGNLGVGQLVGILQITAPIKISAVVELAFFQQSDLLQYAKGVLS